MRRLVQPIDMIQPKAVQPPLGDKAEHELVYIAEGARVLDADAGEVVDVEKPPVVDLADGDLPVRQPVMLAFQQPVQDRDAARIAECRPVDREPGVDQRGSAATAASAALKAGASLRVGVAPPDDSQQFAAGTALLGARRRTAVVTMSR